MHILVIPSWYSSSEHPIAGTFIREQAHALHKAGHQVGVLVPPQLRSKRELRRQRRLVDLSLKVNPSMEDGMFTIRSMGFGWYPAAYPAGNRRLLVRYGMSAFNDYQETQGMPDLIHAHSALYAGYLAMHIKERSSLPLILTEHASAILRGSLPPELAAPVSGTLQACDRVLVPSHAQAQAVQKYSPGANPQVVPNGVDTDFFTPAASPPRDDGFRFAAIGSLKPVKGFDIMLKAFSLAFKGQQAALQLAGDGGERKTLENLAWQLGIGSQVEFSGALSRSQVRELLHKSHCLVSASRFETFGITLIEANACGLPVIATRCGGPEEIINQTNGILVQAGDAPALANGMQQMVTNYRRFDGSAIREDCERRFSLQSVISTLEAIYQELLNGEGNLSC